MESPPSPPLKSSLKPPSKHSVTQAATKLLHTVTRSFNRPPPPNPEVSDISSTSPTSPLPPPEQDPPEQDPPKSLVDNISSVTVAVRVRPMLPKEISCGCKSIANVIDNKVLILRDTPTQDPLLTGSRHREKQFVFDYIFDASSSQQQVYDMTAKRLVDRVLEGYNAAVFTYGATGTGKTYTMVGKGVDPGLMVLTLRDLFQRMRMLEEEKSFDVSTSFLEIYNENIRDLLQPKAEYLELREEPKKGVSVAGMVEANTQSEAEVMQLVEFGNQFRTQEATEANEASSRSHAVLQVTIEMKEKGQGVDAELHVGKLSLIDLAGSERASQTKNRGIRMMEGANINRSLLALGNVISALAENGKTKRSLFIPYRDSKLTRLLKDSLGGNCCSVMITNISPASSCYEDSYNTLKYANRAKSIRSTVVKNVMNVSYHIEEYNRIIDELRTEIIGLKTKLAAQQSTTELGCNEIHQKKLKLWKEAILKNFDERMQMKRNLVELDRLITEHRIEKSQLQISTTSSCDQQICLTMNDRNDEIEELLQQHQMDRTEIAKKLKENIAEAERLQTKLPYFVNKEEMQAFLQLIYKTQLLTVENIELQELNNISVSIIQEKDLEIDKLQQQMHQVEESMKRFDGGNASSSRRFVASTTSTDPTTHLPSSCLLLSESTNSPSSKGGSSTSSDMVDPSQDSSTKVAVPPRWEDSGSMGVHTLNGRDAGGCREGYGKIIVFNTSRDSISSNSTKSDAPSTITKDVQQITKINEGDEEGGEKQQNIRYHVKFKDVERHGNEPKMKKSVQSGVHRTMSSDGRRINGALKLSTTTQKQTTLNRLQSNSRSHCKAIPPQTVQLTLKKSTSINGRESAIHQRGFPPSSIQTPKESNKLALLKRKKNELLVRHPPNSVEYMKTSQLSKSVAVTGVSKRSSAVCKSNKNEVIESTNNSKDEEKRQPSTGQRILETFNKMVSKGSAFLN